MRDMVLILAFDADFARTIARKLRSEHVYCKLAPHDSTLAQVQQQNPSGIILAGGVKGRGSVPPTLDARLLEMGLPLLAMGSAARTLCEAMGGLRLQDCLEKRAAAVAYADAPLFAGVEQGERWLEHVHQLTLPAGWREMAVADGFVVGFAHEEKPIFGLQFQVEKHDPDGMTILSNFARAVCGCTPWWSTEAFVERSKAEIHRRAQAGRVLCAVSGGLDSTVCAVLAHQAVGDRLHCVQVDTGLLRQGEPQAVRQCLEGLGLSVTQLDMRAPVLAALCGVTGLREKAEVVRGLLARTLAEEAARAGGMDVMLRGINYSDIAFDEEVSQESCGTLQVLEPLREMFRDEVLRAGEVLALPEQVLRGQPFPDGGLALRVMGEVTQARLDTLRCADAIFVEELLAAGQERKLWKYFATLAQTPEDTRGGQAVVLRAVHRSDVTLSPARLPYDLLERVVERILREVPVVARVLYDMTPALRGQADWQ